MVWAADLREGHGFVTVHADHDPQHGVVVRDVGRGVVMVVVGMQVPVLGGGG